MTLRELSGKDVIRLKNGENLGRIDDLAFDETGGRLQSDEDLNLPWESIRSIGTDVVMVDADPLPGKHRR